MASTGFVVTIADALLFGLLALKLSNEFFPCFAVRARWICERLMQAGIPINRPPRDGQMAFVRSPDRHSIELLQKGEPLPAREPWKSMPNTGKW